MASVFEQKRIFLFKTFGKLLYPPYDKKDEKSFFDLNLKQEPPLGDGWDEFMERYFKDGTAVETFFRDLKYLYRVTKAESLKLKMQNWIKNVDLAGTDPTNLFLYYACDIPSITKLSYCSGDPDDLKDNDIIGDYTTNIEKLGIVSITTYEEFAGSTSTDLVLRIPKLINDVATAQYSQMKLDSQGGGKFKVKFKVLTLGNLQFDKTKQSFKFKFLGYEGVATRKGSNVTPVGKSETKKDTDKQTTSNTSKEPKFKSTTLYNKTTSYEANPNDVKVIPYVDHGFPFKLKERHELIGDLNQKHFRTRSNDIYTEVLQSYLDQLNYFDKTNLKKEITKDVWDRGMKIGQNNVIKESVKKVLKEYINSKK